MPVDRALSDDALSDEQYCYLTTAGRVSGRPHTIEIWFALEGSTLYMLAGSGERADWVRNARRSPAVTVRIGDREFAGRARLPAGSSERALARRLLFDKYQPGYEGDLANWRRTALPVAVDVDERGTG